MSLNSDKQIPNDLEKRVVSAFFHTSMEEIKELRKRCLEEFGDRITGFFVGDSYVFAETLNEAGEKGIEVFADLAAPLHENYLNRNPLLHRIDIFSNEMPRYGNYERYGLKSPEVLRGFVEFWRAYLGKNDVGGQERLEEVAARQKKLNFQTAYKIHDAIRAKRSTLLATVESDAVPGEFKEHLEYEYMHTYLADDFYRSHVLT